MWPDIGFLSDQHPVVDWLVDKALSRVRRNEAPVLVRRSTIPVVLHAGHVLERRAARQPWWSGWASSCTQASAQVTKLTRRARRPRRSARG